MLATPGAFVTAEGADRKPLGRLEGAVNNTKAPFTGTPLFNTVTWRGTPNGVPARVDCPAPPVAVTLRPDVAPNRTVMLPPFVRPPVRLVATRSALPSPLKSETAKATGGF